MRALAASRAIARLAACAAIVLGAASCELFTHAADYQIADAVLPEEPGLCEACPADATLRHAPCPSVADAPDMPEPRVYAARQFYFGHRDEWKGDASSFDLGLDLDCSMRPKGGLPVLCAADPQGWEGLPRGIDNAWLERILAPLYDAAASAGYPVDLDAFVTENHDDGKVGLLVTVDEWNGLPDDPDVRVSLASSPGVAPSNGAPRWDGEDVWSRFAEGSTVDASYFEIANAKGYVVAGTLVVDHRSHGAIDFRLATLRGTFKLTIREVTFLATITKKHLDRFTLSGLVDQRSALEAVPDVVDIATPCPGVARDFLEASLPDVILAAADMPDDRDRAKDEPCNAISFALAFDAEPALIGDPADPIPPPPPICTDPR